MTAVTGELNPPESDAAYNRFEDGGILSPKARHFLISLVFIVRPGSVKGLYRMIIHNHIHKHSVHIGAST